MENSFGRPIIPENETERLTRLYSYGLTDTYEELGSFKHIASMAAHIFRTPIALVSFVDEKQVIFKANVGMEGTRQVSRGISLCSLSILQEEVTVFENAREEACLLANPLVTGDFGLQFYAAAPLQTPDGYRIGSVCIVDKKPRKFSDAEQELLQGLASAVMEELEEKRLG
ncbi:GAF domain-containing protein [Nafulsella turpanensis]|uniref:GAF domain-containing protein n=1 Tax=Nafulsella turpanensis TaxID=1265690 RepID=UPI0003453C23|nr:GAF domain-containing protein [Nafulsella turpanensis]